MQRFLSTNIVPLVNACWPNPLGIIGFGKQLLLDKRWKIINCCLIDDPLLLEKPLLTPTNIPTSILGTQQESLIGPLEWIKPVCGRYFNTLDKLLDDQLKADRRKQKY